MKFPKLVSLSRSHLANEQQHRWHRGVPSYIPTSGQAKTPVFSIHPGFHTLRWSSTPPLTGLGHWGARQHAPDGKLRHCVHGCPVTSAPHLNKKLLYYKSNVKSNLLMNIKNTSNNAYVGKYWQRVTISKKWLKYTESSWVIRLWDFCSMVTLKESLDYPTVSPYAYVCCLCPSYKLNHFLCATSLTGSILKENRGGRDLKKITARKHTDKIFLTKTTRYFKRITPLTAYIRCCILILNISFLSSWKESNNFFLLFASILSTYQCMILQVPIAWHGI